MMQTSLTDCLILWHQKTHLLSPKKKKGIFLSSKQALSPLFKSLQSFSTFCWVGCWWDRQIGGNQIASMCVVMGLSNKKALWHGAQPAAAAAASLNPLVRGRRGADTGPPRSAAPLRRPSRPLSITRRRRRRAAQNLDHLPWSAHLGTPYHTDLLALTDPLLPPLPSMHRQKDGKFSCAPRRADANNKHVLHRGINLSKLANKLETEAVL
jgi:hypothetical protein